MPSTATFWEAATGVWGLDRQRHIIDRAVSVDADSGLNTSFNPGNRRFEHCQHRDRPARRRSPD